MGDKSEAKEFTPMTQMLDKPEPQPRERSIYRNDEKKKQRQRSLKCWKLIAITFIIISAALLAGIIAAVLAKKEHDSDSASCPEKLVDTQRSKAKTCSMEVKPDSGRSKIFSGLSTDEMSEIVSFLMRNKTLKLVSAAKATIGKNYIYSIEEHLPNKKDVTEWLDKGRRKPERKARVVVFNGETKKVEDFLVGPIPNPRYIKDVGFNRKRDVKLTWKSRPICNIVEAPAVKNFIIKELTDEIELIYFDSFTNGKCLKIADCMYANMAARTVLNSPDRHIFVSFFISPDQIEDYYMYPLPFYLVLSAPANTTGFKIVNVYYNDQEFESLAKLKDKYRDHSIRYKFPFSAFNKLRGKYWSPRYISNGESADQKQRPPQQYYPDGARFSVNGQHVEWLGWKFDIHFRTMTGMQIFDVKYEKERIAYELSMQDIAVLYSGNQPDNFFKNYFDVGWSIGRYNLPLIREVDCPSGAMYLNSTVYAVGEDKGIVLKDAICVFEHINSIPLRHHYSTKFFEWGYRYAFSMPDSVLVVRQILNVWNYDYIFDYEFHQNGLIEVKVSSTGYIAVTTNIGKHTTDRGYVVNPDINAVANLHQHLFNFKLDLDIAGTLNNFKTAEVLAQAENTEFAGKKKWYQMVVDENEIKKESDSALKYKFNEPKQYIIYNKNAAIHQDSDLKRGYRIQSNGFSKVVLPDDHPLLEGGASWAKYQIAVTKFDDNERSTASYFVQGDPFQPAVSLEDFLSGDASLDNVDLVAWVSVGIHHLPTYEDLPVTSTPGKTLSIALVPFNYFKRDPSIHSRDAAVFWSKEFNITNDYLYHNDTCLPMSRKPMLNID